MVTYRLMPENFAKKDKGKLLVAAVPFLSPLYLNVELFPAFLCNHQTDPCMGLGFNLSQARLRKLPPDRVHLVSDCLLRHLQQIRYFPYRYIPLGLLQKRCNLILPGTKHICRLPVPCRLSAVLVLCAAAVCISSDSHSISFPLCGDFFVFFHISLPAGMKNGTMIQHTMRFCLFSPKKAAAQTDIPFGRRPFYTFFFYSFTIPLRETPSSAHAADGRKTPPAARSPGSLHRP